MNLRTEKKAARMQSRWNDDLDREQRQDLYARFEGRLSRLFRRLGLTGWCNDCACIFHPGDLEETPDGWACPECGHTDVETMFGNPNHRFEPEPWERSQESRNGQGSPSDRCGQPALMMAAPGQNERNEKQESR
jgi:hypothetical protein